MHVNAGIYTSPMDPMGIFGTVNGSDFRSWALMFFFRYLTAETENYWESQNYENHWVNHLES